MLYLSFYQAHLKLDIIGLEFSRIEDLKFSSLSTSFTITNMVQLYFASTLWVTATSVVIKKVKPTETQSCGQNWQMRKPLLST